MNKICPICQLPPKDYRLAECDRCKVDELAQIARYILRSPRFWWRILLGGIMVVWAILQVSDYFTDQNIRNTAKKYMEEANIRMQNEITRRFEEPHIQSLIEKTAREQAIKRIEETADTVIAEKIRNHIEPRLGEIDKQLVRSDSVFSELLSATNFYWLVIRALE